MCQIKRMASVTNVIAIDEKIFDINAFAGDLTVTVVVVLGVLELLGDVVVANISLDERGKLVLFPKSTILGEISPDVAIVTRQLGLKDGDLLVGTDCDGVGVIVIFVPSRLVPSTWELLGGATLMFSQLKLRSSQIDPGGQHPPNVQFVSAAVQSILQMTPPDAPKAHAMPLGQQLPGKLGQQAYPNGQVAELQL
jgi:hypothetical protein